MFEMEGGLNSIQIANTNNRGNYEIYLPLKEQNVLDNYRQRKIQDIPREDLFNR